MIYLGAESAIPIPRHPLVAQPVKTGRLPRRPVAFLGSPFAYVRLLFCDQSNRCRFKERAACGGPKSVTSGENRSCFGEKSPKPRSNPHKSHGEPDPALICVKVLRQTTAAGSGALSRPFVTIISPHAFTPFVTMLPKWATATAMSLAILIVVTAILWWAKLAHPVFFYLVPTAVLAMVYGVSEGALFAVAAFVCSAFLLYDPIYSFRVSDVHALGELFWFLVIALVGVKAWRNYAANQRKLDRLGPARH